MPANSETCIFCEESPCSCKSTKRKRAPHVSTPPKASSEPRAKTPRRVIGRGTSVEIEQVEEQVEQSTEDELDADDVEFVYAVRLLAHLIRPDDPNLKKMGDKILPSDLLPPEDRIADWKRRVGGS